MAAIKHDHIVTIYQVGEDRGVPFLAMEFLEGSRWTNGWSKAHKPLGDLDRSASAARSPRAGGGPRHGLIHRDIKPANIWLEAPTGRVKILDFGLARATRRVDTQSGRDGRHPRLHGPRAGPRQGDDRSDLFSLGCVLYRLCTGRLPVPGGRRSSPS